MAIPQIIKKAANDIRTKIKGREVRESLAKGIEESGEIADESNTRSKDTEFRQGVVETQFDDVLAEWSEDRPVDNAETISARTDSETGENHKTLGNRLDEEYKRLTLDNMRKSVIESGAKLDGITDDFQALQMFFDSVKEGTIVEFPPNRIINISEPIMIFKKLIYRLNGSVFRYVGTKNLGTQNGTDRLYGALNIWGSLDTSKRLNVTSIIPNWRDDRTNDAGDIIKNTRQISKVVVEGTPSDMYSVGDIIEINVANFYKTGTWSSEYEDNPAMMHNVAKVVDMDSTSIYIDASPNFIFGGPNFGGYVAKVNTIEDVVISGLRYEDGTEGEIPTNPTNEERESWVGGISVHYTQNLVIEDFESKGHKFPAYMGRGNYNPKVEVRGHEPKATSPGCGYLIQESRSLNGVYNDLGGHKNRHLVDFTSGGNHIVNYSKQVDIGTMGQFDCHGKGEFNITYNDCIGDIQIGNGIESFPCMTDDIHINRGKGNLFLGWVKDITISDSDMTLLETRTTNRVVKFKAFQSRIRGIETMNIFKGYSRGNIYNRTQFILSNVDIDYQNVVTVEAAEDITLALRSFEIVKMNDIVLVNSGSKQIIIELSKCKYVYVDKSVIENVALQFTNDNNTDTPLQLSNRSDMNEGMLNVSGVNFLKTRSNQDMPYFGFLRFFSFRGVDKYKINIDTSQYKASANTATDARWIGFYDEDSIEGKITVSAKDVEFLENIVEAISDEARSKIIFNTNHNNLDGYNGTALLNLYEGITNLTGNTLNAENADTFKFVNNTNVTISTIIGGDEGKEIFIRNDGDTSVTLKYDPNKIWNKTFEDFSLQKNGWILLRRVTGNWVEIASYKGAW